MDVALVREYLKSQEVYEGKCSNSMRHGDRSKLLKEQNASLRRLFFAGLGQGSLVPLSIGARPIACPTTIAGDTTLEAVESQSPPVQKEEI